MYALILKQGERTVGWYRGDDKEVTLNPKEATKFGTFYYANGEAKLCNLSWDLEKNEKFEVVQL